MPKLINKIIKVLIVSDFFLNTGWGLMGPVFAIFIVKSITVGSVAEAAEVAGFASLFYWITKSILQIPIGRYLDINHGEKDDYWFMVVSTFMMAAVPIGYLFSTQPWHIYFWQIFYGIAAAINLPPWSAIFTRHIDRGREAFEWGAHSTVLGIGAGLAGGAGGIAVATFGFSSVFIFVSAFTAISGILLFFIRKEISPINKNVLRVPVERTITEP
jgi:DHA1 family quinolone resistance protein-like MFS transporter